MLFLYDHSLKQGQNKSSSDFVVPDQISLQAIAANINKEWESIFEEAYQGSTERDNDILKKLSETDKWCQTLSIKISRKNKL